LTSQSATAKKWNAGRIYAVFWLVAAWLNAIRMLTIFDKSDKFGVVLLLKLPMVSSGRKRATNEPTISWQPNLKWPPPPS